MTYQRRPAHQINKENLIYGVHPVLEALEAGKEIERILMSRDSRGGVYKQIMTLANQLKVPVQTVPAVKIDGLVRGNHQGILAFVSLVDYQSIENILMSVFEKGEEPLLLILDRITDVRNMGAIARSAECAGVHALIIPSRGSAQLNADAVKTSAGALNSIAIHRSENLKDTIKYLKESGLTIAAVTEHAAHAHVSADLTGPLALILGSEEEGISPEYLKMTDKKVKIPMRGTVSSLNVSVAAGIMIFEVLRQRSQL